jgi:hypothetical protein
MTYTKKVENSSLSTALLGALDGVYGGESGINVVVVDDEGRLVCSRDDFLDGHTGRGDVLEEKVIETDDFRAAVRAGVR